MRPSAHADQLDRVGAFRFEPVAGAQANALPDHVAEELKEERYARIMAVTERISAAKLAAKVGGKLRVIIDDVGEPDGVIGREKASFPLPFQNWIGSARRAMLEGEGLREFVREEAILAVASNPSQYWHLAWPMANLAYWLEAVAAEARSRSSVAA